MLTNGYEFSGGFPTAETIAAAYDDADYARAVVCYKHFFPAVSGMAIFAGTKAVGIEPNRVFGTMDTRPGQVGFTLNSDTPYAPVLLDVTAGPLVVTIPAGPIVGAALNVDQSWISDLGIPGPEEGRGARHTFVALDYDGELPTDGYVHALRGTALWLASAQSRNTGTSTRRWSYCVLCGSSLSPTPPAGHHRRGST